MSVDTPNERLAWPLDGPRYRYLTNVREARIPEATAAGEWGRHMLAVDADYPSVIAERRRILDADARRSGALDHMRAAEWDALLAVLSELSSAHPETMHLDAIEELAPTAVLGDPAARWRWRNDLTGDDLEFRFGDDTTVPGSPLRYAATQVVEDLFLLTTRDGALHLDAVAATFTGSWSSTFSLGISFTELHGPVPRVHGIGLVDRTERFIQQLAPGEVMRRTNWSIYESDELDASLERYHAREPGRLERLIGAGDFGDLRLRVEVQHLEALPLTGAVLFTIQTQLAPMRQLVQVPEWADQLESVLGELPDDMAEYKNFAAYREGLVAWIAQNRQRT